MPKILLVEDDNNLREIYEMLLTAEGYSILTAGDGEEGLSIALKEKPDLIIADVMMPKLSGFEMLENLKAAPEMKDVKVIMMTALGQAEDQARASELGVVKYLVKSQATLEDFARVVKEVLPLKGGQVSANQPKDSSKNNQEGEKTMQEDASTNNSAGSDSPTDGAAPSAPTNPMDNSTGADSGQMNTAQEQSEVNEQVNDFAAAPASDQPADTSASFSPATPPADDSAAADTSAAEPADGAPTDSAPSMDGTPAASPMPPADEPMATPPQPDNPA